MATAETGYTAFLHDRVLARGPLREVAARCYSRVGSGEREKIALYEDESGRRLDLDWRGGLEEVLARLADHPALPAEAKRGLAPRGRGRPKLGVVSREVTLLPRHWEWLSAQRGGASAALRRLVDAARKGDGVTARRLAQEAVHRLLWDLAADLPGFEEATRALDRGDADGFLRCTADWPEDLRAYALEQAGRVLEL